MACNKRNTKYSTHFSTLKTAGGTGGSEPGTANYELPTRGTGRKAYHFQFVIVFFFIFCFRYIRAFSAPSPPGQSWHPRQLLVWFWFCYMLLVCRLRIRIRIRFACHLHDKRARTKWAKWAEWAASWRVGRINTKRRATTTSVTRLAVTH